MYVNIPNVRNAAHRVERIGTDAESYAATADGSMRSVFQTNTGFATMGQLQNALDTLQRKRDAVISATKGTADSITAATRNHAQAEDRARQSMESFQRELTGATTPGEGLTPNVCSPDNPMGQALGIHTNQTTGLAGVESILQRYGGMPPANGPLGSYGQGAWAVGTATGAAGDVASGVGNGAYGRWAPRGADGRFISPGNMSVLDRFSSGFKGEVVATPGNSAARAAWDGAGKWAGRAATGISTVQGVATQAVRDWNDTSLTGDEKVARAVWRGGVEGGTGLAAGIVGAKFGAGIGTLIAPGIGTAIGGVVGGIVGGIGGGILGEEIADRTVAAAGRAWEWITPW